MFPFSRDVMQTTSLVTITTLAAHCLGFKANLLYIYIYIYSPAIFGPAIKSLPHIAAQFWRFSLGQYSFQLQKLQNFVLNKYINIYIYICSSWPTMWALQFTHVGEAWMLTLGDIRSACFPNSNILVHTL